jgi:hypothetical protein
MHTKSTCSQDTLSQTKNVKGWRMRASYLIETAGYDEYKEPNEWRWGIHEGGLTCNQVNVELLRLFACDQACSVEIRIRDSSGKMWTSDQWVLEKVVPRKHV